MARKRAAAKTSTRNSATTVSSPLLECYCRGLDTWPRSWIGWEEAPPREQLVACFRPFLEDLVASDLSPKTIQKHVDKLWTLGGEIIRDLNENPSLRRKGIEQILDDRIDDEGGPLVYALEWEEALQRSFDSTDHFAEPGQITHRFRGRGTKLGRRVALDPSTYSVHSMRSGWAAVAAVGVANQLANMDQNRHRSFMEIRGIFLGEISLARAQRRRVGDEGNAF